MAIKKTVNLKKTTIQIPDAYARIKALRFDHPSRVWVELGIHENEESEEVVDTREYNYTLKDFGGKENISAANAYKLVMKEDEWKDGVMV